MAVCCKGTVETRVKTGNILCDNRDQRPSPPPLSKNLNEELWFAFGFESGGGGSWGKGLGGGDQNRKQETLKMDFISTVAHVDFLCRTFTVLCCSTPQVVLQMLEAPCRAVQSSPSGRFIHIGVVVQLGTLGLAPVKNALHSARQREDLWRPQPKRSFWRGGVRNSS